MRQLVLALMILAPTLVHAENFPPADEETKQMFADMNVATNIRGFVLEGLGDGALKEQMAKFNLCSGRDLKTSANTYTGYMECYTDYNSDTPETNKPFVQVTYEGYVTPNLPILTKAEFGSVPKCREIIYTQLKDGQKIEATCNDNATNPTDYPAKSAVAYTVSYKVFTGPEPARKHGEKSYSIAPLRGLK